jgi:hypothetical protein
MTEQTFYTLGNKKVPPNHVFEYRGIRHIGDPLTVTYEQHCEAVIQKYKNIDAGLAPDGGPKRMPSGVAALVAKQKDLAPANKDFKEEYRDKALAAENEALKARLAELEARMETLMKPPAEFPKDGVRWEDTVGAEMRAAATQEAQATSTEGPAAPIPEQKEAVEEEKAVATFGECPSCGNHFKRLDMHIGRCKGPPPAGNGGEEQKAATG